MADNDYDAVVIGSGISGGWAAKELTEKGLKVLMLERGKPIEHVKDYVNATKEAWDLPHRGLATNAMKEQYPVLSRDWPLNEFMYGIWANESESPYVEHKPFNWFRSHNVGGRSLLWGRQSYRLNRRDFQANAEDGIAIDWPIRYADLSPWYEYVEKFAGIAGNADGIDSLPDGAYLPPMPLNVVERDVAKRVRDAFKGARQIIPARVANLTTGRPEQGRAACQLRNKCGLGCPFGAYFSTQSATLPAAMNTGNLTVRPWSIVTRLLYDRDQQRVRGVEVLDAENNQTYEFRCRLVFLNASTLNSTWVLMNSATDVWEGGLGSSSGQLGHNLMDHHFHVGANGEVDGYLDKYTYGRRPCGFYIPRFANWGDDRRDFIRGYGYQGDAARDGWGRSVAELGVGVALKAELTEPGQWRIGMTGFGETLPDHRNQVTLDRGTLDKWGLPVLAVDAKIRENELKMRRAMQADAVEILDRAGVKNVRGFDDEYTLGAAIHEMGTARMGRDPKTSVLNGHNQVWDAPNVFVTDGACMTSSGCVNPSLTYMALTARAADFAVAELKRGNL